MLDYIKNHKGSLSMIAAVVLLFAGGIIYSWAKGWIHG